MGVYKEKTLNFLAAFLLFSVVFLMIYSPWRLGERELYWDEDYYAVQTLELEHIPPVTYAHGEFNYKSSPLFPLLVSSLKSDLSLPTAFVLRLVSVLALAGVACLVWIAARNAGGLQAASVATAFMISSIMVIEKAIDGYPDTLTLLFLTVGWLVWFSMGVGRGNWNMAWMLGFFFCGLAFYNQGFAAVLAFIFPLIFMRRPMTIWPKLKKPGFIAGLVVLLLFILLWYIPHMVYDVDVEISPINIDSESLSDYFQHLVFFPLEAIIRLLPWSLIAWVPFCVALMPLDKAPIFSRFLRTVFFSLFFLFWIMPDFEVRSLLLLLPPLAILCGIYYEFFIRRYGRNFPRFYPFLGWAAIACGAIVIGFYCIPGEILSLFISVSRGITYRELLSNQINAFVAAGFMFAIGLLLIFHKKLQLWIVLMLAGCVPALFLWGIIIPYKAQARGKMRLGQELRQVLEKENIPANEFIYKTAIKDLYGECFYMGYKVKKVNSLNELPKNKDVIYLISTDYPQLPTREWTNLLPEKMLYRGRPIGLRRGILKKRQFKKWPQ
jgi:4-amino-4-deoxy-L-arabinose transferase-like glycosyltransferase